MSLIALKFPCNCAADSKQGGRDENQDNYGACDTAYGSLLIVCDGMGGGPGGRTASNLAVQAIKYAMTDSKSEGKTRAEMLKYAISYANQVLIDKQNEFPELRGMGTTCTAVLIDKFSAIVAHVGDSRVYRIRNKKKSFRTKDHSKVGEMVCRGLLTEEQARLSAESNIITRALGRPNIAEPDIEEVSYEKGDRFALCTDGIWGMIPESELVKKLSQNKNVDGLVESLIIYIDTLGFTQGGRHDNLTLAILEPQIDSKFKEPMDRKTKRIICALALICILSILYNCFQQLRMSQLYQYKETVTFYEDSCKKLNDSNFKLNDSITKVIQQQERSIVNLNSEKEKAVNDLKKCIESLKMEMEKLKKEKDVLQEKIKSASQPKDSSTSENKKNSSKTKSSTKKKANNK